MTVRISVVIPTYQRPHLLADALASLVCQTMGEFEVLICDNGADDATRDVVARFDDPRFHYHPRSENLGMLGSVLLGFQDARAPIVMKLDDDDVLAADALERLVEPFDHHPEVTLSFGGVVLVDEQLQPLDDMREYLDRSSGRAWFPEGLIRPATWLVAQGGVQFAGAAVRKECVDWENVPLDVATAYDLHVCLVAVQHGNAAWFTRDPVVKYRLHGANDTHRQAARQTVGAVRALERALASGAHGDLVSLERRLSRETLEAGRATLHAGERRQARALLRRSLELRTTTTALRLLPMTLLPSAMTSRLRSAKSGWARSRVGS
ncbi:glycosyltransferase family 2 protein [Serinicoccus sp. LYQ131]|uniref:glycosyltransferase family 2 protein n=1 Tax=Serinicoccus sp. LYQ131 TaxID=3378797 RepID=UPI0038543751